MLQQTHTVSDKGLQSFVDSSPEYELAPTGIASMHEQAQKLAEYGRNGDIYVVHAAEGETVVPMEVLNANPKVKDLLFKQMEEMGLDPQEFVVGNELNSINPDTGLPEFFFKKFFRSVKKIVKKVVKVIKKAAPIVLPIAAAAFGIPFLSPAFFGPGTFGASFLGSGIGSLIGGASVKDSIKAGLISGGIAGLTGGLKSQFLTEGGSFSKGVGEAFYNPSAPSFSTQVDRFGKIFTTPDPFGIDRPGFSGAAKDFLMAGPEATPPGVTAPSIEGNISSIPVPGMYDEVLGGVADNMSTFQNYNPSGRVLSVAETLTPPVIPPKEVSLTERLLGKEADKALTTAGNYLTSGGRSAGDIASDVATAKQTYLKGIANDLAKAKALNLPVKGIVPTTAGLAEAAASAQPGMLAKYGPTLALGAGAAYLGGAFDPPPEDNPEKSDLENYVDQETGYDLFQKDPSKYLVQDMDPSRYDPGSPVVASDYLRDLDPFGYAPKSAVVPTRYSALPPRYSADGGYMEKPQYMNMGGTAQFPRREMLVEGPGTERSDDIPAMLSDGEFVMNAKSVRGADPSGNGNRQAGAANLYNMMRNFEMRS